jgi:hypothetical protein
MELMALARNAAPKARAAWGMSNAEVKPQGYRTSPRGLPNRAPDGENSQGNYDG